MNILVRWQ